jgi:hypothetical protein
MMMKPAFAKAMARHAATALGAVLVCATVSVGSDMQAARSAATASDFVADVVGPYLDIQSALVNDELAPVSDAAKSLHKSASALGADGQALAAAAARAADAKTVEAARAAFGDLSTALIAYADRTKQPIEGKIVAFCPMANKSWVQADGAIANPYYGKSMRTCGNSTRKLSATQ